MYIEFRIPSGGGGMPAQYANYWLKQNIKSWAEKYNIAYRTKDIKYTVRLTFDDDKFYNFFAVTWDPKADHMQHVLKEYRLIEPMKVDKS
jgi:hypothetical protein